MEKYLSSVLIGDELAAKIRAAFDAYIFLSYRKKDRKYAQELMNLIHKNEFCRDIAIWYDEFLNPGENFNESILEAIKKSSFFVMAVTPNLINEENYISTTEYPLARQEKKLILPAELVPTDAAILSEKYKEIPCCTDAYNSAEWREALLKAVQAVGIRENDDSPEHNFFIGLAYLGGIDVEVDHEHAIKLITSAANAGLEEAVHKLVMMYRNGEAVARDCEAGIRWQYRLVDILKAKYQESKDIAVSKKLWQAQDDLGEYLMEAKQLAQAKDVYGDMVSLSEELAEKYETSDKYYEVAIGYRRIGDICQREGKLSEAEKYYEQAVKLGELVVKQENGLKDNINLVAGYLSYGNLLYLERDFGLAAEYYKKAIRINESLLEEHDIPTVRRSLSVCCERLGRVYEKANFYNNISEAISCFEKTLKIREELLEQSESYQAYRDVSVSCEALGDMLKLKKDFRNAYEYYQKALTIREMLYQKTNTVESRQDLAIIYCKVGDSAKMLTGREAAKEYYEKDIEIRMQLVREYNQVKDWELLALTLYKHAILYISSEVHRNNLKKSLDIMNMLCEQFPSRRYFAEMRNTIQQTCEKWKV